MYSRSFLGSALIGCALTLAGCSSPDRPLGAGGDSAAGGASDGGHSGAPTGGKEQGPGGNGNAGSATGGAGGSTSGGAAGSGTSGGAGGSDAGTGGAGPDEYGFTFRTPGTKNLDWLCTFHDGDVVGHVYVRLLQTGTSSAGIATVPVYSAELAQISVGGRLIELSAAMYDYGGGHHNDSLSFEYAGKSQRYYHSSFGFGFRSCQNMDCRNVQALGTTAIETEGCASDRGLPEVCVSFDMDGSHDPLVDEFMKCPGDTQ
jgi:hypothetical protein